MATLTLKIEGPPGRVPATALASVLTESLKILEDLRKQGRDEPVIWYVTDLKIASATASVTADGQAPLRLAEEYVNGLRFAEAGEALPPHFSDTSLRRLQRMARPLGSQDAQYLDVSVGQNGSTEFARATARAADNISRLRAPRSKAIGSITGILDMISVRTSAKFQVVDPVSCRPVTCYFPKHRTTAVTNALEQRVVVSGTVVRNAKGQPVRVDEATFEILPEAPRLAELVGIDPNFTGGLSLHDYMERICS